MKRLNGEGNIRRRENGTWEARYYDSHGKRHSVYGKTQQDVRKKLDEAMNAPEPVKNEKSAAAPQAAAAPVAEEKTPNDTPDEAKMTVAEWLTTWRQDFTTNIKGTTAVYYDQLIRCHIVPFIGDTPLQALRAPAIQRLYNDRQANGGLSAKSIKNLHGCLHKALDTAVKVGYWSTGVNGIMVTNLAEKTFVTATIPQHPQVPYPILTNLCKKVIGLL